MPQKLVTSYDVAQLAGVSQPTVSRAFSADGNILPTTRVRVLEAAKKLGYKPNAIARSLTTQRTDIIGIIMGDIARSHFYPAMLVMFTRRLQAMGKQVLLFNSYETGPVDAILPRILGYQVDALVIASTTPGREIIDECTNMDTPVILLNRTAPNTGANAVCSDNETGGRLAADLLLDSDHQRLAFLAGVGVTETNLSRRKGFVERLRVRGYGDVIVEQGDYSYESGYEAALQLLDRDNPPDAIFCAADIMALGAMDAARYKLGINIPDELSIIGYDNIAMAGWPAYNLTTIRQPISEMVDMAIQLLTPRDNGIITGQVILMPVEMVHRNSVRIMEKISPLPASSAPAISSAT